MLLLTSIHSDVRRAAERFQLCYEASLQKMHTCEQQQRQQTISCPNSIQPNQTKPTRPSPPSSLPQSTDSPIKTNLPTNFSKGFRQPGQRICAMRRALRGKSFQCSCTHCFQELRKRSDGSRQKKRFQRTLISGRTSVSFSFRVCLSVFDVSGGLVLSFSFLVIGGLVLLNVAPFLPLRLQQC